MNTVQKILTEHVMRLEADHEKMKQVRAWYDRMAGMSTAPYTPWDEFKELEEILGDTT